MLRRLFPQLEKLIFRTPRWRVRDLRLSRPTSTRFRHRVRFLVARRSTRNCLAKAVEAAEKGMAGGGGSGSSSKAATEFFGIGGYGQTFVYVVDCSGSMNENDKFDRARYELLKSIEQLGKDQQYFVIFYNHQMYPMPSEKPLMATPDNLAKTTDWINHAEAMGGTVPMPALMLALSMKPDAIYFLTDGQFDPA